MCDNDFFIVFFKPFLDIMASRKIFEKKFSKIFLEVNMSAKKQMSILIHMNIFHI